MYYYSCMAHQVNSSVVSTINGCWFFVQFHENGCFLVVGNVSCIVDVIYSRDNIKAKFRWRLHYLYCNFIKACLSWLHYIQFSILQPQVWSKLFHFSSCLLPLLSLNTSFPQSALCMFELLPFQQLLFVVYVAYVVTKTSFSQSANLYRISVSSFVP